MYVTNVDLYFLGKNRRLGFKEEEGATVLGDGDPGKDCLIYVLKIISSSYKKVWTNHNFFNENVNITVNCIFSMQNTSIKFSLSLHLEKCVHAQLCNQPKCTNYGNSRAQY